MKKSKAHKKKKHLRESFAYEGKGAVFCMTKKMIGKSI